MGRPVRGSSQTDGCIWEEGGIDADGYPTATLGARGLLYVDLSVETLSRDAHSGQANLLPNANWRLVWALASIKGQDERVLIPGYYDAVRPPSARQLELLSRLPSQEESVRQVFGLDHLLLRRTGDAVSRATFEPTGNIAGMAGGYQGPGAKTVIPARAVAKMDFRLVPDQDPDDIMAKLRRHLDEQGFSDVKVTCIGGERPGVVDPDAPMVAMMTETAQEVYGKPARVVPLMGGTTPMFLFTEQGIPVVNPGVGYGPHNGAHGPDEHVRLHDFELAARHIARLTQRFAEG